ncbi:hypothetical protein TrCOL_g7228 [Triparma columacea]|uniref:Nudix hydrolase domain-containing protein n=1 Tax=Triparma columacea TaxID=722753 RepID=A0A9W7GHJ3_9STRA|nr:hypothetical protein TrCOL_g7228 [Triparma columacea]
MGKGKAGVCKGSTCVLNSSTSTSESSDRRNGVAIIVEGGDGKGTVEMGMKGSEFGDECDYVAWVETGVMEDFMTGGVKTRNMDKEATEKIKEEIKRGRWGGEVTEVEEVIEGIDSVDITGTTSSSPPTTVSFGHHLESWCLGKGRFKGGPKGGDRVMVMVNEKRGRGKGKGKRIDEEVEVVIKIDLPGGKRELCENSQDAARRECWEETGVVINKEVKGVGGGGREVAYWYWYCDS